MIWLYHQLLYYPILITHKHYWTHLEGLKGCRTSWPGRTASPGCRRSWEGSSCRAGWRSGSRSPCETSGSTNSRKCSRRIAETKQIKLKHFQLTISILSVAIYIQLHVVSRIADYINAAKTLLRVKGTAAKALPQLFADWNLAHMKLIHMWRCFIL